MGTQASDFYKNHLVISDDTMGDFDLIKEATVQKLVDEGLLDEKAANLFCETFGFVVFKKPWYKRIFEDRDDKSIQAKLVNLKES